MSHYFKSLKNFTMFNGYIYYQRLRDDVNMRGHVYKIRKALSTRNKIRKHTWEAVGQILIQTGQAEQGKEINVFKNIFGEAFDDSLSYEKYPEYINAINELIGLRDRYGIQLKQLRYFSDNQISFDAFQNFEEYLQESLVENIREIFGKLGYNKIITLSISEIEDILNQSLEDIVQQALIKMTQNNSNEQNEDYQFWQDVLIGLKQLNNIAKNNLISRIINKYGINEIIHEISIWLKDNFAVKKKNDNKIKGLKSVVKSTTNISNTNALRGLMQEYIIPLINTRISQGTVIGGVGTDRTAADSVLIASVDATAIIPPDIIKNYLQINASNIKNATEKINLLTTQVLDRIPDSFVIYESSKMYAPKSVKATGFTGRSGNLANLGEVLKQYDGSILSELNVNVAYILYQTMNGAILEGEREELVENTKKVIIETIAASLFDDVNFIGTAKSDNVIHMLDLNGIQIPLSFYCIKLGQAIQQACGELENIDSGVFSKTIRVSITDLPDTISFPTPEDTKKFGEDNKISFPGSVYEAWNQQKKDVEGMGHFTIHFLRNFDELLDDLIKTYF